MKKKRTTKKPGHNKRSTRRGQPIESRQAKNTLEEELRIAREFMAEYRETLAALAKA